MMEAMGISHGLGSGPDQGHPTSGHHAGGPNMSEAARRPRAGVHEDASTPRLVQTINSLNHGRHVVLGAPSQDGSSS